MQSSLLLKFSIGAGALLGLGLLVQSVSTYLFVSKRFVEEEAERQANRKQMALVGAARGLGPNDTSQLEAAAERVRQEAPKEIAWIRLSTYHGTVLAQAGDPQGQKLPSAGLMQERFGRREPLRAFRETSEGPVLILASHMRFFPKRGEIPPPFPQHPPDVTAEIAIYMNSVSVSFAVLRRNLVVECLASLALLASLGLIAFLWRRYTRVQEIERQVELAQRVQRDLLPAPESGGSLDFAAACIPAAQVGGDFYDVFQPEPGRLALVLGDVSGKGLSAALLMGVIHGAVRSTDWTSSATNHEGLTERLNRLLCEKSAKNRFASMFWAYFDPRDESLRYVNAGHLPPLLVRKAAVERLEGGGGPVLGLLPGAAYHSRVAKIEPGDLLVIYSDGILEALNTRDEEFGEERIVEVVRANRKADTEKICEAVLAAIRTFLGPLKPHDDQTLVVVRLLPARAGDAANETGFASPVSVAVGLEDVVKPDGRLPVDIGVLPGIPR